MSLHYIVWYCMVLYLTVVHGIALLGLARGLYLARHLSTLLNIVAVQFQLKGNSHNQIVCHDARDVVWALFIPEKLKVM